MYFILISFNFPRQERGAAVSDDGKKYFIILLYSIIDFEFTEIQQKYRYKTMTPA